MGQRGPKPAPTAMRLLRGETRPSRINGQEPRFSAPASVAAPAKLTGAGRREWVRLAPMLVRTGVLSEVDLSAFADYCYALSDLRRFEAKAARLGAEQAIARGFQNAVVKLRSQVAQLRAALGLTPSSRSSVKGVAAPQSGSPLEQFKALKGGRG